MRFAIQSYEMVLMFCFMFHVDGLIGIYELGQRDDEYINNDGRN